jgi:DNA-binding IclR family transcriptional regulator
MLLAVIEKMGGDVTPRQIAEEVEAPAEEVLETLGELSRNGYVKSLDNMRWALIAAGV